MTTFLLGVLSTPALLIGLITALGLLLQRTPLADTVKGSVKATLGFVVLQCGGSVLCQSLKTFGILFEEAFHLQGVIPNNEAITATAISEIGFVTSLIMLLGMIANILFARFTPMKYIFLTGHHTFFMAALIAAVMHASHFSTWTTVVAGSLLLGFLLAFFPATVQWVMRKISGSDDFALGHFGSVGYLIAALVGKYAGGNSKSIEEISFPKSLMFFRDTTVSMVLSMLPLFLVVAWTVFLRLGEEKFTEVIGEPQNLVVFCIMQSILFAAGIYVVLLGVRLILAEILPAFKGISEKLVPNAKPAMDCPLVFPFAPNAVIIGFFCSFLGGLLGLALCGYLHWTLILPGVIPHFFCGATAGVFANATGGRRGCVIGAFCHGILITFLPLMLLPVLGSFGYQNTTFGDSDFAIVGIILGNLLKLLHAFGF
ncbi:MAG: PTS ascorbate transporter subunit IIC [Planctomycetaceae bacterium]|nr:PTS ascorbate transporter subunit IIC [Planctomycetaceae bacterium]